MRVIIAILLLAGRNSWHRPRRDCGQSGEAKSTSKSSLSPLDEAILCRKICRLFVFPIQAMKIYIMTDLKW